MHSSSYSIDNASKAYVPWERTWDKTFYLTFYLTFYFVVFSFGLVSLTSSECAWADERDQHNSSVQEAPTPDLKAGSDTELNTELNTEPHTEPNATSHPVSASPISPPKLIRVVEAVYPPEALTTGAEGHVELIITVCADGSVGEVKVSQSAGEQLDAASISAVRQWRFEPAKREGRAIDIRIQVPFHFTLPVDVAPAAPTLSEATETPETQTPPPKHNIVPTEPPKQPEPLAQDTQRDDPIDVTVQGAIRSSRPRRSASDFRIDRDVIAAAPKSEGAEVLRAAPGLYIGRAGGAAVAHTYMLRGFDAEHGQDIEFRVGGIPINLPSHIHGQGYSDLGFLIGDVVNELSVTEGVYDPRQGDFAVAGSIGVQLGVVKRDRGVTLRSGYGAWGTSRQLALWAPHGENEETFGVVQYTSSEGFGEQRRGQSASGIFQRRFGSGTTTARVVAIVYAARADLAGVTRRDDVASGRVCFTCAYEYPTARAQNALANRLILGVFADHRGARGARGQLGAWVSYDNFRIQHNFTGFLQRSRTLERVAGRGDLIEQQNRTASLGLTGSYRAPKIRFSSWARGALSVGSEGRIDVIDQAQRLLDASVRSQTWDNRVNAEIRALDLGMWSDFELRITDVVKARVGARADVLSYDVDDKLGNFAPLSRPQDAFITGFRRSALGLAWGPRASLEGKPLNWLSLLVAYGEGYRSPQARILGDGEQAPFSKVSSLDAGIRMHKSEAFILTLSGYLTELSDDVAFDAAEGRLERIGATQRLGAVMHLVTRPLPWLVGSLSLTFVHATLLEPPPPSAEEPQPPFVDGQQLPFVPPLVARLDLGARHVLIRDLGGRALEGRLGLGFSHLSPRPLPYQEFADPVSLLDVSGGLTWGALSMSLEVFNALNAEYAALEYSFPSDWDLTTVIGLELLLATPLQALRSLGCLR